MRYGYGVVAQYSCDAWDPSVSVNHTAFSGYMMNIDKNVLSIC